MSEIGTLAAMASSPRAGTAALRAAVRDTKAILALAKVILALPSPGDGEVAPDLPRIYHGPGRAL